MNNSRYYSILPIYALWCLLCCFVPASVYWRDAGEFIITAFFLDIPHPGGFPTYSQLSNIFALLPLGPIAFRVNAFSAFALVACFWLAFILIRMIHSSVNKSEGQNSSVKGELIYFSPLLILLALPVVLRQALTAEVYVLNTLFILLLLICLILYRSKSDIRFIYAAAFLSGLGIGNHVSITLCILPLALIVFYLERQRINQILAPALVFGFLGVAVYLYLPVRAAQNPPLNTGGINDIKSFTTYITAEREKLKKQTNEISNITLKQVNLSFVKNDLDKLIKEIGLPIIILSLIGIVVLSFKSPPLILALISVALGNWYFFKGWDPDPWVPLVFVLAISATLLFVFLCSLLKKAGVLLGLSIVAVLTLLLINSNPLTGLKVIRDFSVPAKSAEYKLKKVDYYSTFMTEAEWFLFLYLQEIEGYRRDILTVYQPALFFPAFFKDINISDSNKQSWTNNQFQQSKKFNRYEQNTDSISSFIDFAITKTNLFFSPSLAINSFLHPVTHFHSNGELSLKYNTEGSYSKKFLKSYMDKLSPLTDFIAKNTDPVLITDSKHHFELNITQMSDLLNKASHTTDALTILSMYCGFENKYKCTRAPRNNLAVIYMQEGHYTLSGVLLFQLLKERRDDPVLRKNLKLLLSKVHDTDAKEICHVAEACELLPELLEKK